MSFEIPLIIDSFSASSYNLPGFIFNKNYCELHKLSDISIQEYDNIVEKIKIFNENTINTNYETIMKLL